MQTCEGYVGNSRKQFFFLLLILPQTRQYIAPTIEYHLTIKHVQRAMAIITESIRKNLSRQ